MTLSAGKCQLRDQDSSNRGTDVVGAMPDPRCYGDGDHTVDILVGSKKLVVFVCRGHADFLGFFKKNLGSVTDDWL